MQKIIIMGNLGSDPSYADTKGGAKMLSFTVAVNRKSGENRITTWYRVKTMNYSQNFAKALKKGSSVIVTGDLTINTYVDKNGVERPDISIWADSMEFGMSSSNGDGNTGTTRTTQVTTTANPTVEQQQPTVNVVQPQVATAQPTAETSSGNATEETDLPF